MRDIPYLGPDRKEKMDLYLPAAAVEGQKRPAIVIIHGGGYTGGSKSSRREIQMAQTLSAAGYVCASIDYRLASKGNPSWPGVLEDCRAAVRFLRAHADEYGIDPERIGAIGGSAGGLLSLLLGTREEAPAADGISGRVSAVVALYAPTDLTVTERERTVLIGHSRAERPDLHKVASPLHRLTPDYPPTLLIHGTADKTVELAQSELLKAAMEKMNLQHELIVVPGGAHSFPLKNDAVDFRAKVVEFLDRSLRVAPLQLSPAR
ncbi:MAG TPA: alpha/beta hydrolase [Tepidisphaeraceae bacterium]|nr:alpha/beta hydrolase [Tepidisphaeraceae bacterium]